MGSLLFVVFQRSLCGDGRDLQLLCFVRSLLGEVYASRWRNSLEYLLIPLVLGFLLLRGVIWAIRGFAQGRVGGST